MRLHTQSAIDKFCTQLLPAQSKAGQRIKSLWHEYEENATPEARFVKDLDKLELGLQGVEYERGGLNPEILSSRP